MNNLIIIAGVVVGFMLLRRSQGKIGDGTTATLGGRTITSTAALDGENGNGGNGGRTRGTRRVPTLIERISDRWGAMAERVSSEGGSVVPATLILAVIRQESAGDPNAVGSIGEVGLMQMTPAAWEDATGQLEPSADPLSNMMAGATYLMLCNVRMGYTRENPYWLQALRAYNAGASAANRDNFIGRAYAESVMSYRRSFEEVV